MSLRAILIVAATCAASVALAADRLPLQTGVFVRADVVCKGASNADTLSYWGEDGGINDQQDRCTIQTLERRGDVYRLGQICEAIRFGGQFSRSTEVRVLGPARFEIENVEYRRCGDRVEF